MNSIDLRIPHRSANLRFAPGKAELCATIAIALLALCAGCAKSGGELHVLSFADPYFPEPSTIDLSDCTYRIDHGGDIHFTAHSTKTGVDGATEGWLHVHVYWKPKPGKTPDDPTAADALVRYLVKGPGGSRLYTGSAFVYPERSRWHDLLTAEIEAARLQPVQEAGEAPTSLGDTRLSGVLKAREDNGAALDVARQIDLRTGQP
jgi:hypothetical protein